MEDFTNAGGGRGRAKIHADFSSRHSVLRSHLITSCHCRPWNWGWPNKSCSVVEMKRDRSVKNPALLDHEIHIPSDTGKLGHRRLTLGRATSCASCCPVRSVSKFHHLTETCWGIWRINVYPLVSVGVTFASFRKDLIVDEKYEEIDQTPCSCKAVTSRNDITVGRSVDICDLHWTAIRAKSPISRRK